MNQKVNKSLIRPSNMPLVQRCQSSLVDRGFNEHTGSLPASLGICAHEIFEKEIVPGNKLTKEITDVYAEKHNVPTEGFMGLDRKIKELESAWVGKAKQFFPEPILEKSIGYNLTGEIRLQGTPDVAQLNIEQAFGVILDLKTGESDILDMMVQIKAYCLMFMREHSHYNLQKMYGFLFNPVTSEYQIKVYTAAELDKFEIEIKHWIDTAGETYSSGAHCDWCPRLMSCPKHLEVMHGVLNDQKLPEITFENIKFARPIVKMMEKFVAEYAKIESNILDANKGEIDLGENILTYRKQNKRTWNTKAAVRDLRMAYPEINEDQIFDMLKFSKSGMEDYVKSVAAPKMKGKDVKAIQEVFDSSDACVVSDQFVKTIIKKENKIEHKKIK